MERFVLRALRHWLTENTLRTAVRAAPHLSPHAAEQIVTGLIGCGAALPPLAERIAGNMRSAGVYHPAAVRMYFRQLGQHLAGALYAMQCTIDAADDDDAPHADRGAPAFSARAAERIELGPSVAALADRTTDGRGAIIMAPHINSYLLFLARLNQAVPLTVYLRHSSDTRRQSWKRRWYRASGVDWIAEPPGVRGTMGRLGPMAGALEAGRTIFITPDLPQKPSAGTPVACCGRELYLPAGAALLAVRTGAPLFVLTAEPAGTRLRLHLHGPHTPAVAGRGRDARRQCLVAHLQWFAAHLERLLTQHPQLWYLWGDKRWTRVFRNDPRYTRPLPGAADLPAAANVPKEG